MGKRQLGELQPFEFAITLVASELACIPMSDPTIPIIYGIIPVFTLFVVHIIITKIASKSVRFRGVLNGKPVIVMEEGNILPKALKELNMDTDDLMEALRGKDYFNPTDVEYAIVETNGSMSVLPKAPQKPLCPADLQLKLNPSELPITMIMEGKFMGSNLSEADGITKERVMKLLERLNLKQNEILLLLVTGSDVFLQPYSGSSMIAQFSDVEEATSQSEQSLA